MSISKDTIYTSIYYWHIHTRHTHGTSNRPCGIHRERERRHVYASSSALIHVRLTPPYVHFVLARSTKHAPHTGAHPIATHTHTLGHHFNLGAWAYNSIPVSRLDLLVSCFSLLQKRSRVLFSKLGTYLPALIWHCLKCCGLVFLITYCAWYLYWDQR